VLHQLSQSSRSGQRRKVDLRGPPLPTALRRSTDRVRVGRRGRKSISQAPGPEQMIFLRQRRGNKSIVYGHHLSRLSNARGPENWGTQAHPTPLIRPRFALRRRWRRFESCRGHQTQAPFYGTCRPIGRRRQPCPGNAGQHEATAASWPPAKSVPDVVEPVAERVAELRPRHGRRRARSR
jgi:hypothetical protein